MSMPRKADEFEVLEKPKRVPKKRVPNAVADSDEEKPKRKRSVKKVPESTSVKKVPDTVEPVRRAPTVLNKEEQKKSTYKKNLIIVGVLIVIGVGSSAIVGLTDKGQIDVVTIIEERNKKAVERGEKLVSSSDKDQLPDGGLIPADPSPVASTTPPITASTTASTTPQGNIPRTDQEIEAAATSTQV
jgi:hypothetical protein